MQNNSASRENDLDINRVLETHKRDLSRVVHSCEYFERQKMKLQFERGEV